MVAGFTPGKVVLDRAGLNQLYSRRGVVGRYEEDFADEVLKGAKRQAGSDTGQLRQALRVKASAKEVLVGAFEGGTGYALFHHKGTKAHPIDPVHKTILRFRSSSGAIVYARHVNHPGTRPNDYLAGPARRLRAQVKEN